MDDVTWNALEIFRDVSRTILTQLVKNGRAEHTHRDPPYRTIAYKAPARITTIVWVDSTNWAINGDERVNTE